MMQLTITSYLNILRCFDDNAFFSSSRDSNTMVDQNKLSLYLEQLRDELIAEIEKLFGDSAKVKKMSENAAKLHLTDTDDRILNVVAELFKKSDK